MPPQPEVEAVSHCLCGSSELDLLGSFEFWARLQTSRCARCGLVFLSRRLTRAFTHYLFSVHYFRNDGPGFWRERRLPIFRDVERLLRRVEARRVWDVGTAYGDFPVWLEERGYTAGGSDISQHAVEVARRAGRNNVVHGELADLRVLPFEPECITILDTLYYSHDPERDLTLARRLLPSRGALILRLRDGSKAERRARVGDAPAPAGHLWAWTPRTAAAMLERCGYRIARLEPGAYSRNWYTGALQTGLRVGRALRLPLRTQNFNIVGVRV